MKKISKVVHYGVLAFIILIGVLMIFSAVYAGTSKESELRGLYMRSGALEFEQKQIEIEAMEIRDGTERLLTPLRIRHDQLTTERASIDSRLNELEGFLVEAVEG